MGNIICGTKKSKPKSSRYAEPSDYYLPPQNFNNGSNVDSRYESAFKHASIRNSSPLKTSSVTSTSVSAKPNFTDFHLGGVDCVHDVRGRYESSRIVPSAVKLNPALKHATIRNSINSVPLKISSVTSTSVSAKPNLEDEGGVDVVHDVRGRYESARIVASAVKLNPVFKHASIRNSVNSALPKISSVTSTSVSAKPNLKDESGVDVVHDVRGRYESARIVASAVKLNPAFKHASIRNSVPLNISSVTSTFISEKPNLKDESGVDVVHDVVSGRYENYRPLAICTSPKPAAELSRSCVWVTIAEPKITQKPVRSLSTREELVNTPSIKSSLTQTQSTISNAENKSIVARTSSRISTSNTASINKQTVAIRKKSSTVQACLNSGSTVYVDSERYLKEVLSSAIVNSYRIKDNDDDNKCYIAQKIAESADGSITFSNSKCQLKSNANQQNQKSKIHFKQYWPRNETRNFFNKNFENYSATSPNGRHLIRLTQELKSNSLTEQNYLDALLLFADIEDLHCDVAIRVYNRKSEKIDNSNKTGIYIIKVPNLIDSCPSISVSSRLTISSSQLESSNKIYGTITDVQPDCIMVEFNDTIDTTVRYDVNFLSNRTTFRMEKLAIDLMRQKNLVPFMFPNGNVHSSGVRHDEQDFVWFNNSVANNFEQQTVIENIYHGTSYPYPYIVFGPPGTGKTTTLVESILQLWKNKPNSRLLIVATSNFACNVISKCLLQFLPKTEMFRLFSKTQELFIHKIDTHVLDVSNLKTKIHYTPKSSELYPYRIIIATPTASGRLILEGFDCNHFTHLFIDECGSCTEGSSLIPIAGLISSQNMIRANIVLAGDPLQLRPVIHSKYAENLGYGISMIERLMEFPLYKRDEWSGEFNNKFITKLLLNYRSHNDILHISNVLFYNSELKALGSKDVTDWIINWRFLPNPKFPIKFVTVFGESKSENGSPSLYNKYEIDVVMSHLNLLVNQNINGKMVRQSDIGVISPYRKQNQKIRAACDYRKWRDVEVATVEAFQGNEKSVIILSTVRSKVDSMGFLSNERRLNVALTRAKGFLIIIGDPKVLMKDNCWYQLMKFCYDNNAICGESFDFYD